MYSDLHKIHAHVESGVIRYGEDCCVEEDLLGDDGGGGAREEPVEGAVPREEHRSGEQGAKGHVATDSGQVEGAAPSILNECFDVEVERCSFFCFALI